MCRFIAYLGKPVLIEEILYKPRNSLIRQSIRARESEEPLNGDGFGLGWYNHDIDFSPGLFTSIQPAWNDRNLMSLSSRIRSGCFFAHVRAASNGAVSQYNCHPFQYRNLLFMHNGDIGGFARIKRYIRRKLNDEIYEWIQGQTDSEHFFALLLNNLNKQKHLATAEIMADVVRATIIEVEKIKKQHGIDEVSYINAAISDGMSMVAVRYVSDKAMSASSLHYAVGAEYQCNEKGYCHMQKSDGQPAAVLVSSEKLSSYTADWQDVPQNNLLLVDKYLDTKLQPLALD